MTMHAALQGDDSMGSDARNSKGAGQHTPGQSLKGHCKFRAVRVCGAEPCPCSQEGCRGQRHSDSQLPPLSHT